MRGQKLFVLVDAVEGETRVFDRKDDLDAAIAERGEVEVHSYSLMTTHYHLLVRRPGGRLASATTVSQTLLKSCKTR